MLWKKIYTLPAFMCAILFYVLPEASSEIELTQKERKNVMQVDNQPFQLECTIKGTVAELAGKEITWDGPDPKVLDNSIAITGKDNNGKIEVIKEPGNLTSILTVPKAPALEYKTPSVSYHCYVSKTPNQASFSVRIIKASALPKFATFDKPKPVKRGDEVVLNCSVTYDHDDYTVDYFLVLTWSKDGKILEKDKSTFKVGNYTESINRTFDISTFRDGGDYVCQWEITDNKGSFVKDNNTYELQISAYLDGPPRKEVKDTAGSDVELHCDVIGYPIKYEWRDEKNALIVSDSRIRTKDNVLAIDDIDYDDRKSYYCHGIAANTTKIQIIILRVKDHLGPLWPFIGIVIEAIVVAAIIWLAARYKTYSAKQDAKNQKDSGTTKLVTTEQPSTSQA